MLAGGPQDGQTYVVFSDALSPSEPPAGSDVESRCTVISKREEEAEGFIRSETEPSEVQDQSALAAEADHDGHQADMEDPQDGYQSTNSGQSRESATCTKHCVDTECTSKSLE